MVDLTIEEYFGLKLNELEINDFFIYKENEYQVVDKEELTESRSDWIFYHTFVEDTDTGEYWRITTKEYGFLCGSPLRMEEKPCRVIPKEKVVIEWWKV